MRIKLYSKNPDETQWSLTCGGGITDYYRINRLFLKMVDSGHDMRLEISRKDETQ